MSKLKRKVTVDSDDRRKPSVFERLGPGATRRSYGNYDDSDSDVSLWKKVYFDMLLISSVEFKTERPIKCRHIIIEQPIKVWRYIFIKK